MQKTHNLESILFQSFQQLAAVKPTRFGHKVTADTVKIYVEKLKGENPTLLKQAIEHFFLNELYFPDISEIVKFISPQKDPNEDAGKIIECISRFGKYNGEEVKTYLGETLWHAVELFGGWQVLCETETDQLNTVRAQLRDLCKAPSISKPKQERIGYEGMKTLSQLLEIEQ